MSDILTNLIKEQELVLNYLVSSYDIVGITHPENGITSYSIKDKLNGKRIYGEEITSDLKLFLSVNENIIDIVIQAWASSNGIDKNHGDWYGFWTKLDIECNVHVIRNENRYDNIGNGMYGRVSTYGVSEFTINFEFTNRNTRHVTLLDIISSIKSEFIKYSNNIHINRRLLECTNIDSLVDCLTREGYTMNNSVSNDGSNTIVISGPHNVGLQNGNMHHDLPERNYNNGRIYRGTNNFGG